MVEINRLVSFLLILDLSIAPIASIASVDELQPTDPTFRRATQTAVQTILEEDETATDVGRGPSTGRQLATIGGIVGLLVVVAVVLGAVFRGQSRQASATTTALALENRQFTTRLTTEAETAEALAQIPAEAPIIPIAEDALTFSQRDAAYNKVLIKETIHHVDRKADFFANIYRNLPAGGIMLLVHVPPDVKYPLFDAALERCLGWHVDPNELVEQLKQAGISVSLFLDPDAAQIEAAHAKSEEMIVLADENSLWGADVYVNVAKDVPGAQMASISGTFLSKVFEGPYKNIRTWISQMHQYVKSQGKEPKKLYFYYTTCPRCAKVYGKNYVVLLAQV